MPVLTAADRRAVDKKVALFSILLVLYSICLGQNSVLNPRPFRVEELKYKGTRVELVGNEIEVVDPLVYWEGTPRATCTIFADREGRDTVSLGVCQVQGRPSDQNIITRFSLPREGIFYVVRIIEGRGVDRRIHRYGAYWIVEARWPVLNPEINRHYYYGQSAYFDFAAGHSNYTLYSYELLNSSSLLLSGQGTVVPIDTVWKMSLRYLERPITIRALYNGTPFRFRNPRTSGVDSSVWRFTIRKPALLEILTAWNEAADFSDKKARGSTDSLSTLDANMTMAFLNPAEFRFAYVTRTPTGIIVTPPEPKGAPSVTCSAPEAFMESNWVKDELWGILHLIPNHDYLRRYSSRRPAEVTVTISFQDQFNVQTKSFTARVFSSK